MFSVNHYLDILAFLLIVKKKAVGETAIFLDTVYRKQIT